jgi:NCS1 family nucleobase:cation symporter-1
VYRDEVVRIEPKGIEHVIPEGRHGKVSSVFTLWFGANVELATLTTGTAAVTLFGLSFWQAAIGLIVGNVLGVLLLGLLSTYGPKLGVPQMVQSRSAFGFFGNFGPGTLTALAGVMWFAVNTVLGAFAFQELFRTPFVLALLVMVVLQVVVAVYGYNMIHLVERWLAVVLTLVFVGVSIFAFTHVHYRIPYNSHAPVASGIGGGMVEAVGLAFSYLMGWTVYASDYTRYLPQKTSARSVFWNASLSNFIACVWLELLGVAMALVLPVYAADTNPTLMLNHIRPDWLGPVALVAVVLGTLTANVLNIYSGSLSSLVINIPLKRWMAAVMVGILGGILADIGHRSYYVGFQNFLFLLGYWLAPWAAIVLVDYFWVFRGRYQTDVFYDPRRVFAPGFWAWVVAIVVSIPFFNQTLYQGPFARHFPQFGDLSYYVGFVVAGILYWILARNRALAR